MTTLFAQTPVDFKRLGSEYVLCENGGLLSNDPDSTDKGVLISNLKQKIGHLFKAEMLAYRRLKT